MPHLLRNKALILFFLIGGHNLYGQTIARQAAFDFSNDTTVQIQMEGFLDSYNTFTYPNVTVFEPMVSLSISNQSDTIVRHPRVVINNRKNWFDIQSLRSECFEGANTEKEKALALWQFFRNNRLHYNEPECCDEINDPIKLFGVYGYGMCYNTNYANTFMAQGFNSFARSYSTRGGRHFVSEIGFEKQYALIDGDLETFYLKSDNRTLAAYQDVINDKNLIRRVHHYGKAEKYNVYNSYISEAIYSPSDYPYYFGRYKHYHTLDFSLRPGESIEYNWSPGPLYHSYGKVNNALTKDIANGKIIFNTNFLNTNIANLIDTLSFITTEVIDGSRPNIHSRFADSTAAFVLKVTSPFVILDGTVTGRFVRKSSNDSITISFSKDSTAWQTVWVSADTGVYVDTIHLYDQIATLNSTAIYSYFLRFEISSDTSITSCGIDSLNLITDFQVSRSFLPHLQLGINTINYNVANTDTCNVKVLIKWNESLDDSVPTQITSPTFPANKSITNGLRPTFYWPSATDATGITDYEFYLSDREDMRFPLTPSFEVYTSLSNQGVPLNQFTVPFEGLLNSGSTYYWKVRAKNTKGFWGPWSPVWTFTPMDVMPPANATAAIVSDSIVLTWKRDSTGVEPEYYEVHASRERLGFTPEESTLIATTEQTTFSVPFNGANTKTYYRIIARGTGNQKSGPSDVVQIPYPYAYIPIDTVHASEAYALTLSTNRIVTRDMIQLFLNNYLTLFIEEDVEAEVMSLPAWLTFDPATKTISGTADYQTIHSSDSVRVKFRGTSSGYEYVQAFLIPVEVNRSPTLSAIDTMARVEEFFEETIYASDADIENGDDISRIEILSVPQWLKVDIDESSGTVSLYGTPKLQDAGDHVAIVRAFDSVGDSTTRAYQISVIFSPGTGFTTVCRGDEVLFDLALNETATWNFTITEALDTIVEERVSGSHYSLKRIAQQTGIFHLVAHSDGVGLLDTSIVVKVNHVKVMGLTKSTAVVGMSFRSQLVLDAPCNENLNYRLIESPLWLRMDSLSGKLTGVPQGGDIGESDIVIQIRDRSGKYEKQTFRIQVNGDSINNTHSPQPGIIADKKICRGQSTTLFVTLSGTAPFDLIYTDGKDTVSAVDIDNSLFFVSVAPQQTTRYSVLSMLDADSIEQITAATSTLITVDTLTLRPYSSVVAIEDVEFNIQVIATGECQKKLKYTIEDGPAWISIDENNGILTGTPGKADVGTAKISVLVTDAYGNKASTNFDINVVAGAQRSGQLQISGQERICRGESGFLQIHFTGAAPWRFGITDDTDTIFVNNIYSTPYYFTVSPQATSSYHLVAIDDHSLSQFTISPQAVIVEVDTAFIGELTNTIAYESNPFSTYVEIRNNCAEVTFTIDNSQGWLEIDSLSGKITGTPRKEHVGSNLATIKLRDHSGRFVAKTFWIEVISSDSRIIEISPNPFKYESEITFAVAAKTKIQLLIYDLNGREVERLLDEDKDAGTYKIPWTADGSPPGIYMLVMRGVANGGTVFSTRRMIKIE
jgi:hypothetical protein